MKRTHFALTVFGSVVLVLSSMGPAVAAADADERMDLQAMVTEFLGLVPGGVVAATVHDGVATTAAAGIVDAGGDPLAPDSPFVIGIVGQPMEIVIVLQLVEEGRLELDEPVVTYLPDAPIAAEATVRDLLNRRAGLPNPIERIVEVSLADPGRTWTLEEMVGLIDPAAAGSVGAVAYGYGTELLIVQLIEAVEGADYPSVLEERIVEPLGLEATGYVGGGRPAPRGLTTGWRAEYGIFGDPQAEIEALTTIDPRTSSATDLVIFMTALIEGRLISDESLALMFDKEADFPAYGWDGHGFLYGDLGDLGAYYFNTGAATPSGHWGVISADPESGDIVVVLANNMDLFVPELMRQIVSSVANVDG